MDFEALAKQIGTIQDSLQAQAAHAVNLALTTRNWLMGCYIVELVYPQLREPIVQYVTSLFQIRQTVSAEFIEPIRHSLSAESETDIRRSVTAELEISNKVMNDYYNLRHSYEEETNIAVQRRFFK